MRIGSNGVIRFFKSSTIYAEYLQRLYEQHPGLETRPYGVQYRTIMADRFGWSDFWKTHLEAAGRFNVEEVIINWAPLQQAWAREAGIAYSRSSWMFDILKAQMEAFRPDVWFVHGYEVTPEVRLRLRKEIPCIRWIMGWDGIVRNDAAFYEGTDQVLACHPDSVAFYACNGFHSHHFRLGFEESILEQLVTRPPKNNLTFVGGLSLTDKGHNRRLTVLDQVAGKLPVNYWLSGDFGIRRYLRDCVSIGVRGNPRYAYQRLAGLAAARRVGELSRGSLFGLEMYQALADSKIVLNVHIDAAGDRAANMRLFEATGCGACLVTDWKDNLTELFDTDAEIVTFRNSAECIEKIGYLLDHEEERQRIARAGQARTLRDHSLRRSIADFAGVLADMPSLRDLRA